MKAADQDQASLKKQSTGHESSRPRPSIIERNWIIDLLLVGLDEIMDRRKGEARGGVWLNSNEESIVLQRKEIVGFRVSGFRFQV